ncbi:hypothetical protein GCM10028805_17570 [Spirosoma harenae]
MQSFTKGQSVLLIEQTEGSVAKTYVIANHPTRRKHPRYSTDTVQDIDIYVLSEKDWQESRSRFDQFPTPWYGPTL